MEMMNSIAYASMAMSAAQLQQSYSVSLTKKAMESAEQQAAELLEALPQVPKGQYIDVYA